MPNPWIVENMQAALTEHAFPTVTIWNRLEGRPRSVEFQRALRAEIRDALWMLCHQWQLGEFKGDDAGSPILARYQLSKSELSTFRAREGTPTSIDETLPLEAVVERRPVSWTAAGGLGAIDLRLMLGRRWLSLVPFSYRPAFVARFAFESPDATTFEGTELVSHVEVWATLKAVAGRAVDGLLVYDYLTSDPSHRPWDGIAVAQADKTELADAADAFVAWAETFFTQPAEESSWDPTRLEHRFSVTASVQAGEKELAAEEYPGGRLDWHAFSVDKRSSSQPGVARETATVIPADARFDGMPHRRWWAFEDGRTSFGDIRADTTDLARLLLIEFGLVYANDWFIIPVQLDVGSVARVEGLAVTNVFGERLWIDAAGRGRENDWQRWAMFMLDVAGVNEQPADTSLLLLPTVPKVAQGPPLEDVVFLRDEIANLVWAVERVVPLASGVGKRGHEAAAEALAHRIRLVAATPTPPPEPAAPIAYRVMSSVPEEWIPFIPTHVPGDVRETQLQRAALPRLIEGDPRPVERIRPRTTLLREGLDRQPAEAYLVHEEEVPRSGTRVTVAFQRTRWRDGRVVVWLATHRETGRGEGSSGLAFDQVIPT